MMDGLRFSLVSVKEEAERNFPLVIPRSEHLISRKMIDEEALKVLYRLHRHGYLAYLVGGSVRDLLLGKVPKDFDVVTNAHPYEIKALFRNSRIIGRRFRLVHVFFSTKKTVEVSTFRSRSEFEVFETEEGEVIHTESFGTPEEDAMRRDITINGLFYNIADFSIIDCVGGMADLKQGIIRTIGDPGERFHQDPVRMIRVIRHAARTNFVIEERTYQAILHHREEIRKCSPSRLRDEFLRDLKEGMAQSSLHLMLQTGLFLSVFADFESVFGEQNPSHERNKHFFLSLFGLVDQLLQRGRPVSDAVLIALFLTPLLRAATPEPPLDEKPRPNDLIHTLRWAISQVIASFSFPRGIKEMVSQILMAQWILDKAVRRGFIPKRIKTKKYFQDAALLFGIKARAKGEKIPWHLRRLLPSDLFPGWLKRPAHSPQRVGSEHPTSSTQKEGTSPTAEIETTTRHTRSD
jgi:poly(A) polymerase